MEGSMRSKSVFFVVALFLLQGYALNMNVEETLLNPESDESATAGRSSNVMPAISDTMQQYILDTQDQNGADDNDGDGIADDVDKDDDNDCVPDVWDATPTDFDGDGINDHEDIDDDGDGFNDSSEVSDSSNMTNIYDADNDGYHDCSSMGMLQMNMLDVEVYVMSDGSVYFYINASGLSSGESANMFWNLVDNDDFYEVNNSTDDFVVPSYEFWVDSGTWYGLADGPYCLNVELSAGNSSGNTQMLDSEQECFTIDSSSNGGGGGSGTIDDCDNNTEGYLTHNFSITEIHEQDYFELVITATCLLDNGTTYQIVNQIWQQGGSSPWHAPYSWQGETVNYNETWTWIISDFNPGTVGGGNWTLVTKLLIGTTLVDQLTHDFCVNTNNVNCSDYYEDESEDIHPNCEGEFMPESMEANVAGRLDISMVTNSLFDPEYSGNDIIETNFNLCWTPTNASVSMTAWLNATDAPYNGPTQGGEQIDRIVYSGFDANHQGHKSFYANHTNSQMDSWNYTAAELDSGWYCWEGWLKVDDLEGGQGFVLTDLILWDATCFEVVEEEPEDNLTGFCSFPTFGATPTELLPGEDLTFTWTMDGDVSDQVYLALMSGWGAQYYFSSIEDNDGTHTITLPTNMNPNADYTIYIESAYNDNRTTLCWKYGSIDILNEGEEPVDNETVPTPTVDETPRISMWYGKVNQHNWNGTWMTDPDGVAGAGMYQDWGDEGWGDRKLEYCQRFWPSTVDVVLRDMQEEIVFYTRGNIDGYVAMKPVWECILEEDQVPVLTGSCTIDLTVTPQEITIGETLTMQWTMTGDIPAEVRVAVASHDSGMWNVGVQYHVSQHIANTGIFEYVIPAGMNPDRDYVVYVDAVLTDDFTTYCWKYGSFDLLADNEGAIEEVMDNLFNTTDRTPRISMWYGKVNQHNENGTWMTDPDGTAGAGNYAQFGDDGWGDRKLEYCQRFWPNTLAVEPMGAEEIVFYTRGNSQAYLTVKPVWECVHDTDGDGEMDNVDADDDNDGWTDILEQACGTNELDPSDVPVDSNGDQICDLLEEAVVEAAEDSDGLPTVGFLGTLAILSAAFVLVSRKELEE